MGMDLEMCRPPSEWPDWYSRTWGDPACFRISASKVEPLRAWLRTIGVLDAQEHLPESWPDRVDGEPYPRLRSTEPGKVPAFKFAMSGWVLPEECLLIAAKLEEALAAPILVDAAPYDREWLEGFMQFNLVAAKSGGYTINW